MSDDDGEIIAPSSQPLTAILLKHREAREAENPDLRMMDSTVLKDGPRAYKVATHWVIVDRHTGEVHHHTVTIKTYRRLKAGWITDDERSITIDDETADEIMALTTFLGAIKSVDIPDSAGDYIVIPVHQNQVANESVQQLLGAISSAGKAEVIAQSLVAARGDADVLNALVVAALADPQASNQAAAALKAAGFSKALEDLEKLIESSTDEKAFQKHLSSNPWMFGSEYSELLDRRTWTRDEQQDFVLRRTVDNYLEIIEIKTPLENKILFIKDRSHDTHYPRAELTEVIGQVMYYLEQLDANRHAIRSRDGEDVCKIRAKIIIGRDGDADQVAALRRLNGHLHRIEVLTFDQLVRIARQVVVHLRQVIDPDHSSGPHGLGPALQR